MQDILKALFNYDRAENTVMHDLYYGHIAPFKQKATQLDERKALNAKIESETRYFEGKIPSEDMERFRMFLTLYDDVIPFVGLDAFTYGFRLATRLTTDVFTNQISTTEQK